MWSLLKAVVTTLALGFVIGPLDLIAKLWPFSVKAVKGHSVFRAYLINFFIAHSKVFLAEKYICLNLLTSTTFFSWA